MRSSWAPAALFAVSMLAHVVVSLLGSDPFGMIDLRVYLDGARWSLDGTLYDSVSRSVSRTGDVALPFTYPPFAALVFLPLSVLPFALTRVLWQIASVAALAGIVALTLRLMGRSGPGGNLPPARVRAIVLVTTALGMWFEPVRTTFNYGQINLFLAVLLLAGAVAAKEWLAGATVGLAAGIKLVPAVTGLYYLAQKRWTAAVASVAAFAVTVAIGAVVLGPETKRYFSELIFDPARTGPVFNTLNQSWRGALARIVGREDFPAGWIVGSVITVAIGGYALLLAVRAGDRLAGFLVVQVIGLLVSPISWSHHWVWALPIILWCLLGARRNLPVVRGLATAWILAGFSFLISFLVAAPDNFTVASRSGLAAWLGAVYPILGLATLVVVAVVSRRVESANDTGVRCAGLREGHEAPDRRT